MALTEPFPHVNHLNVQTMGGRYSAEYDRMDYML